MCALAVLAVVAARVGPLPAEEPAAGPDYGAAVRAAGGSEFWGSVLVARGGKVLFAEGFGAADYDERPNAPDTLFELASASKQVTATAILKLEQQKKLKTSDSIAKFFRDAPEDKHAITLDHLLHHTSGLADDLGVPYSWEGTRATYVRQMLAPPLAREPGKTFAYSNVGYALLAAVVEEVTKRSFEEYCHKELFKPAGLVDTGFVAEKALIDSPRVSVRKSDDSLPGWTAAAWWYGWGYRGMGGVVSTVLDVERWDRALRGDKVLGSEAKKKLHTPSLERYACGWIVEPTERGTTKAHHSGGVRGYAVQVSRWLEEDALVVVLSNGKSDIMGVERALAALLFPPPKLTLTLDAGGLALGEFGQLIRERGTAWRATRRGGEVRLELVVEDHAAAELAMPAAVVTKLVSDLESALAASTFPEPDQPAAFEGGVYFNLLGRGVKKAVLDQGLALRVMPSYRGVGPDGQPVTDPRTVLVVESASARGWPLMARLNPSAVRALIASLRE
jgi:CubicO group peptidase (beta-lactamase class C family)